MTYTLTRNIRSDSIGLGRSRYRAPARCPPNTATKHNFERRTPYGRIDALGSLPVGSLKELEDISERFNRVFGRLPARRESGREAMTVADWVPTVDITEDDKEYVITAEIPEVNKKDVKVTVQEGMLTVQGERKQEKEEKGKRFHRVERSYGTFVRSFALPEDTTGENIKAEFKEGMLYVHVPKSEKARPKAIEVKVD